MLLKKLMLLTAILLMCNVGLAQNHGHKGKHHGMGMISPMPNLMKVVKKFGDQLNLSKEQSAELAAWREKNHARIHAQMADIKKIRLEAQQAALKGALAADLQVYVSQMDQIRNEIIATKIACCNNMKRVLNAGQWGKVITLYSEHFLK